MRRIALENLNALFAAIAQNARLYLPVDGIPLCLESLDKVFLALEPSAKRVNALFLKESLELLDVFLLCLGLLGDLATILHVLILKIEDCLVECSQCCVDFVIVHIGKD
jgi:hypothetical protein